MSHIIWVYGTLKKWFWNHWYMKNSKFIWEDSIKCYWITWIWFPKASFVDNYWNSNSIDLNIELYEVSDEDLIDIDRLEWHPNFYTRFNTKTNSWKTIEIYTIDVRNIDLKYLNKCSETWIFTWVWYKNEQ